MGRVEGLKHLSHERTQQQVKTVEAVMAVDVPSNLDRQVTASQTLPILRTNLVCKVSWLSIDVLALASPG